MYWFPGFLVSWFLGFKVYWFRSFLVSKFVGFKVSWFRSIFVSWCIGFTDSMIPYYPNSISCVLEDIDPISNIFKNLLGIYRRLSCPTFSKKQCSQVRYLYTYFLLKDVGLPLKYLRCLGVSKDRSSWFWEPWTRPKIPTS